MKLYRGSFFLLSYVIASVVGKDVSYAHIERVGFLRDWTKRIKEKGIGSLHCDSKVINGDISKIIFIRNVKCGGPLSRSDFSWDGKLNKYGELTGVGTLELGVKSEFAKKQCIQLGLYNDEVFGREINRFTADFTNGVIRDNSILKMEWRDDEGSVVFKAEASVKKGVIHGAYKVEDPKSEKWQIGSIFQGRLDVQAVCWIFNSRYTYVGVCKGFFEPSPESRESVIFTNDYKTALSGRLDLNDGTMSSAYMIRIESVSFKICPINLSYMNIFPSFTYKLSDGSIKLPTEVWDDASKERCGNLNDKNIKKSIQSYFIDLFQNFSNFFLAPSNKGISFNPKEAVRLIDQVEAMDDADGNVDNLYEGVFTFTRKSPSEFHYTGELNKDGSFEGLGILEFSDKSQCVRGKCFSPEINLISGIFKDGILNGPVFIISENKDQASAAMAINGILHGKVLTLGLVPHYPFKLSNRVDKNIASLFTRSGIGFYGNYINGKPKGLVWYGMIGTPLVAQGYLTGVLNTKGKLTGSNITYVYPNLQNVLHGTFENKFMKSAEYQSILGLKCDAEEILQIEISKEVNDMTYFWDPPSNITLGSPSMLTVEDPYQASITQVKESDIPKSGNGVFAKKDVDENEILAWYSGSSFTDEEHDLYNSACKDNTSLSYQDRAFCLKYRIFTYKGALIDIPKKYDKISAYNATIAHKCNNGFGVNTSAIFHQSEHPRFGLIVNLISTRPIKKDQEILIDYGYKKEDLFADEVFKWYFEDKDKYLSQEKSQI